MLSIFNLWNLIDVNCKDVAVCKNEHVTTFDILCNASRLYSSIEHTNLLCRCSTRIEVSVEIV